MAKENKGKGSVVKTTIFIIQAYEAQSDTGQLMDTVVLELIDISAERAIERAKKIVEKKFYRLSRVIEKE